MSSVKDAGGHGNKDGDLDTVQLMSLKPLPNGHGEAHVNNSYADVTPGDVRIPISDSTTPGEPLPQKGPFDKSHNATTPTTPTTTTIVDSSTPTPATPTPSVLKVDGDTEGYVNDSSDHVPISINDGKTTTPKPHPQTTTPLVDPSSPTPTSASKTDGDADGIPPAQLCLPYRLNRSLRRLLAANWGVLKRALLLLLLLGYVAYLCYSLYREFGDEPSVRLLVCSLIVFLVIGYKVARRSRCLSCSLSGAALCSGDHERGMLARKVIRWSLYVLASVGAVVVVVVEVALKRPENLVCLAGLLLLLLVCFFISREPEKINWHAVFWGMQLQFWFAVFIRKTAFGAASFEWLASRVVEFLKYTDKGSQAVFGNNFMDHRFVFAIMPTMIFFNAVIAALYYLGAVQVFIATFGKGLSFCIGTSPIESVNAAANLFLTLSEAPILIKPFMEDITQSELFAVMTGGFASIAGSLLWAFAAYGAPVDHILTASVMSAPAALAFAKLIYPDERKPTVKAEDAYKVDIGHYGSLLGALSSGAKDGLTMVGFVVINLLIYVALLEFLDQTLLWFTERAGVEGFTFSTLIAYIFYPVTFLMGFPTQDCFKAARLLGVKILTTTTLTFIELGTIITNGKDLAAYVSVHNDTWRHVGEDIFLEATNVTLVGGTITERSGILATYMLCGLSNLGAIGIAIGSFAAIVPSRNADVIRHVPLALLVGNFASFSTACVAGLLHTG